jgi:hypothetical protein
MGFFNWGKKKKQEVKEETKEDFLAFVLLDKPMFDFQELSEWLQKDWDIKATEDVDSHSLVTEVDDMRIIVGLIKAPVPEVTEQAKTNNRWEEANSVAEKHQAHLIVTVMKKNQSTLDAGKLFVKVVSSISKQSNVIGLNTLGSVLNPKEYIELAESTIKSGSYPVMNLVYVGLYSGDRGSTFSAYTYGLSVFGKKDMEIVNSQKDAEEVFSSLITLVNYVVEYDVVLKDGETIGFTEEEKLKITYSKAVALPDKSLKIAY